LPDVKKRVLRFRGFVGGFKLVGDDMELHVEHYRMVDADYAIVGVRADIGLIAKKAANALRSEGIRVGAVVLLDFDAVSLRLAHLLAQVKAVGVFEFTSTWSRVADALAAVIEGAAQEPEWPASVFVPRVYSVVPMCGNIAPQEGHLIGGVKAMREYGPNRLLLTANGIARPSSGPDASVSPMGAHPSASRTAERNTARFVSVA
jgi:hypothetical protein